jgi:hypothetical protein
MIGDAVQCHGEHQLAGPCRPAQCRFGVPHSLTRADDPPDYIG